MEEALLRHSRVVGDCVEWISTLDRKGYGVLRVKGVRLGAHRAAFWASHGVLPPVVMHVCDNPKCVKVDHLRAGTQAENMADASRKGRMRVPHHGMRGEKHWNAKLTPELAEKIRAAHIPGKHGHGAPALARRFGLSVATVGRVLRGVAWTKTTPE